MLCTAPALFFLSRAERAANHIAIRLSLAGRFARIPIMARSGPVARPECGADASREKTAARSGERRRQEMLGSIGPVVPTGG